MSKKRSGILFALIPGILAAVTYWGMHRGDFNMLDDLGYLFVGSHVRTGLTLENISWALTTFFRSNWHPLTLISYQFDFTVFGEQPFGFLLHNYLLHIANSVLLYLFLAMATQKKKSALLVACLWAVHPLNAECVAWISQRKSLEAMFYGLPACIFYIQWARSGDQGKLWLSYLFTVLSLSAKPMFVVMPFLLTLWDIWPLKRIDLAAAPLQQSLKAVAQSLAQKWVYFLFIIGSSILAYMSQAVGGGMRSIEEFSTQERISNVFYSYGQYIIDSFAPLELGYFYPWPNDGFSTIVVLASLAALILPSLLLFRYAARLPEVFVGWFWFVGSLVPVIGLVKLGDMTHADRYMYLPLAGMLCAAVFGLQRIPNGAIQKALPVLGVAFLFFCTTLGIRQQRIWTQEAEIYRHTIAVTHDNFKMQENLATYLFLLDHRFEAYDAFQQVDPVRWNKPDVAMANLAVITADWGRCDEALALYDDAIEAFPRRALTYKNAAELAYRMGDMDKILTYLEPALALEPDNHELWLLGARIYLQSNQPDMALNYLDEALLHLPTQPAVLREYGLALQLTGDQSGAIRAMTKAVKEDPQGPFNHYYLARLYLNLGNYREVQRLIAVELENNPTHGESLHLQGMFALEAGKVSEAVQSFTQAVEANPALVPSWLQLGLAAFNIQRYDKSAEFIDALLALDPNHVDGNLLQAQLLMIQGKPAQAENHLNRIAQTAASSSGFHEIRGDVAAALQKTDEAMRAYQQSIDLGAAVNVRLKQIALNPEADDAIKKLKVLQQNEPNNIKILLTTADVYQKQKRADEALETLKQALEIAKAAENQAIAAEIQKRMQSVIDGN